MLATLVVLEHSYFLVENTTANDPLSILSCGQMNFGQFAVYLFFALSGFLVTNSLCESSSTASFIAKRIARIVPGFLVASAVGWLIVGPLTADHFDSYFSSQNWRGLIIQALVLKQTNVAGVLEGNPVRLTHGTLWTIQYEFDCYILLALFGALGFLRRAARPKFYLALGAVIALSMATGLPSVSYGVLGLLISSPERWPDLFAFFFLGSAFFLFRDRIPKSAFLCASGLAAIMLSFISGVGAYFALLFCGVYALLYVALSFPGDIVIRNRRVDLSYGVYLYGWPIQQLLLYYSGMRLSPVALFLTAVAFSYPAAWASWTFIERPCLRLAHRRSL